MKSHILCIDLESWVFSQKINSKKLNLLELCDLEEGYTPQVLEYILKILKRHDQRITFFVVTKLEEMYPGIIKTIQKEGHEVGWHTHTHQRIDNEEILTKELMLAEKIIKKYKIKGFQAPELVFFRDGYKILKDFGFTYSSSTYGNTNKIYEFDKIHEVPVSISNEKYLPSEKDVLFPSKFNFRNMLKYGIPYGSSFFWGILGGKYYINKLEKMKSQNKICNLFVHDWQLLRPKSKEYQKDVNFFWNPLFLPYKRDGVPIFESLISSFKFMPMIKLFS